MNNAKEWIEVLQLERHLPGGWLREVYRASEIMPHHSLPGRFSGDRSFSTAIYYLLSGTDFEALHRLKADEIWHAYDGAPLTLHTIDPFGNYATVTLGKNVQAGEHLLVVIEAGWLFGATVNDPHSYTLAGCTVAPGFDFADFEMPDRAQLLEQYPQHRQIIEKLTR